MADGGGCGASSRVFAPSVYEWVGGWMGVGKTRLSEMWGKLQKYPHQFDAVLSVQGCRCQNRWFSGRGSRTVRLRLMVTRGRDTLFTQVRALSMEVIPYFLLD